MPILSKEFAKSLRIFLAASPKDFVPFIAPTKASDI
jgi:hypothetical protein